MALIATVGVADAAVGCALDVTSGEEGLDGSKAESPLPSGLRVFSVPMLFIFKDFLSQSDIALSPS